ncbi:MAG: 23S rRNA pseudouridine(1911/1915/1917) synthase RluD [Gammaproteobacteria bacterium]|nr:23S rRNA pseudouridine(1911/1915/1917) synthase RluD [Gammaproteobacteria bacterium]
MTKNIHHNVTIPEELSGMRLDQALSKILTDYSRTQIQEWIKSESIQVDGKLAKSKQIVIGGETIDVNAALKVQPTWEAQNIALNIIYEDESLMIINKPVGMVVHPGAGNYANTLLNALLHYCPDLNELPRAGIIHRLDKDTSGLLVIAKTAAALTHLTLQLKNRTITRIYQAVITGVLTSGGKVDAPIGRHPIQRKRMAVMDTGKVAVTHYRIMERYRAHTRVKVQLETGRTHQIRVHMAHIHHALLGDPVYNGRLQLPKGATPELVEQLRKFKRQALHASELGLVHPRTLEPMSWRAPLPDDMAKLIESLRNDTPTFEQNDYDY